MFTAPKPPITVAAALAEQRQWQQRLPAVGSLKALQGVELSLEVEGIVKALYFDSGQTVKAGQLLLRLNDDQETALLGTAVADLGLAKVDFGRGRQLVGDSAISRGEYDRLNAQYQRNQAVVEQLKASKNKKSISAPFSGTLGIRQVDVGDYLAPGTVIATLQDTSGLYVDFNVPEQALPRLSLGQQVLVQVAAYPDQTFPARLSAINPKVDETTRNLLVRATWPTPTANCCRACSPACRSCCPIRSCRWWCRKVPLPTPCTATRYMSPPLKRTSTASRSTMNRANRNGSPNSAPCRPASAVTAWWWSAKGCRPGNR